jgi:mannosyl-glycoprotein endo-beta-N-acetylglucosaminidase
VTFVTEGTKLTVTATSTDDTGRLWGKTPQGWACLQYTNYDAVIGSQPVVPETPQQPPVQPETPQQPPVQPETPPAAPEQVQPADPQFTANANATVVANGCLYIRKGPGTGYDKVGEYPGKSRIRILEQKSSGISMWGKTDKGWVSMAYVRMDGENDAVSGGVTGTIQVQGALRVRKGAGTGYGIAGYYYNGATVTILEQVVSGAQTWGKTKMGWISMDYVDLGGSQSSSPEQSVTPLKTAIVATDSVLNIRSGAGTGYAISGFYNRGDIVAILEEKQVGDTQWGKTSQGWIALSYTE